MWPSTEWLVIAGICVSLWGGHGFDWVAGGIADVPGRKPTLQESKTTTAKSNVVASVKAKVLSFGARVKAAVAVPTGSFAKAA